jgi:DNA (cytosine-5)-methyltransferase 1
VWENVPGVLSSNGGKDFGTFLGALGELGYGFAYRVLDAQHFGVAQRRRRVFVVGYLGDWRVAAAVLFESESLQGNTKPSRKKRQEVTTDAQGGVRNPGTPRVSNALCARDYKSARPEADQGAPLIIDRAAFNQGENAQYEPRIEAGETMSSLVAKGPHAIAQPIAYSFDALSSNSMKSSNPNSGCREVDVAKTLDTTTPEPSKNQGGIAIAQPLYYESHPNDSRVNGPKDVADSVSANYGTGGGNTPLVQQPIPVTITFNDANGTRADRPNGGLYVTEEPRCTSALTCGNNDTKVMQPMAFKEPCPTLTAKMQGSSGWAPYNETDHLVGQPIAVDTYNYTTNDHTTQTIRSQSDTEHIGAVLQPMAFPINTENMFEGSTSYGRTVGENNEPSFALTKAHSHAVGTNMAIRRLTPKECERLQGFPDDWTKIPYRNKPADQCPDGPRYKACGNSMAVPVMRWIGERIQKIENLLNE